MALGLRASAGSSTLRLSGIFLLYHRPSYFLAHEQWQSALFIYSFGPLHSSVVIVVITTVLTSQQRVCIVLLVSVVLSDVRVFLHLGWKLEI